MDHQTVILKQLERTGIPFNRGQSLREGLGPKEAVKGYIRNGNRPAFVGDEGSEGVLSGNTGIAALDLAGNSQCLTHKRTREVKEVDAHIHDGQALEGKQVRLSRVDVPTMPEGKTTVSRRSDRAGSNQVQHSPEWALPPEVLVDE
jgi:hypothetical protein